MEEENTPTTEITQLDRLKERIEYDTSIFTDEETRAWKCYDLAKITGESIGLPKNFFEFSYNIL